MKPAIVKRVLNQLNLFDYHCSALYAFIQLWVFLFSYWKNHFGALVFFLFFFFNTSSFSNISQPRLSLSRYGHGSHEWPWAITATQKWCLLAEILNLEGTTVCWIWLWNLPASRCAGAGILNIFLCIHCDFDASLFAPKNATNLSPLSFLSLSTVCDSQRPPIPATYFKFRLGLTNHHISLRSKRFLLVSEQRRTEAQVFRFWPRENGLTIGINGKSRVALFFAILLLRLCFFVLLLLIPSLF